MNVIRTVFTIAALVLAAATITSNAQTRERSEIEDRYKWDLSEIYSSPEEWKAAKLAFPAKIEDIQNHKGGLVSSAGDLYEGLSVYVDLHKEMLRLYIYPLFLSSLDQRDQESTAMRNEAQAIYVRFGEATAFIDPEILSAPQDLIRQYVEEDPRLKEFDFYLFDLYRQNEHVLSEKEEKLLGLLSISNNNSYDIFNSLLFSDLEYPEVTLSGGETVVMDRSTLSHYLESGNRADRKHAMEAYYGELNKYNNTFAQLLVQKFTGEYNLARARNYGTVLEMSMDQNNIPVEIYHNLIKNTNDNLDAHYRYWKIKKRMLGVDTIKMYDLVAPVVGDIDLTYTYEEARDLVMEALRPMSDEYRATVRTAFEDRWIDVYPAVGKRIGAYSSGAVAYDLHPFILLNYLGFYRDVSTLIHEIGHTMHDYYACRNQSWIEANYTLFIAEVASTINSILLIHSMLEKDLDEDTRLTLLMNFLDEFIATLFRQVMYAEFELAVYERIENSEPLNASTISDIFGEVSRKYYGHDEGISDIEEQYFTKWSRIGHYYGYTYYVYVYATSFIASVTLADRIVAEEDGAVERFMDMISAGGSDYAVNVLKQAGVDHTTPEPFEYAMESMHRLMDEVESILDSRE